VKRSLNMPTWWLCLWIASGCGAVTWAQSDAPPPPPPPPEPSASDGAEQSRDTERLRERLAERLERVRLMEARLEQALAAIDAGEPVQDDGRRTAGDRRRPGLDPDAVDARRRAWRQGGPAPTRPDRSEPMTEERRERILSELDLIAPRVAASFRRLAEGRPERADAALYRMERRLDELRRARRLDPESAELKAEEFRVSLRIAQMTYRYREALSVFGPDARETQEARAELRDELAVGLEVKLRGQRHELEQLERRVADLKKRVADQRADPDRLIDQRLEQITDSVRTGRPGRTPE